MTRRKLFLSALLAPFAGVITKLKPGSYIKSSDLLWAPKEFTSKRGKDWVLERYIQFYKDIGYNVKHKVIDKNKSYEGIEINRTYIDEVVNL